MKTYQEIRKQIERLDVAKVNATQAYDRCMEQAQDGAISTEAYSHRLRADLFQASMEALQWALDP